MTVSSRIAEVWEADPETASRHYLRALDLQSNDSYVLLRYADFLGNVMGLHDDAAPHIERAQALDPLSIEVHQVLCANLMARGRADEAYAVWQRGVRLDPGDLGMLGQGLGPLAARGDYFGLLELGARLIELDPENIANFFNGAI